MFRYMCGELQFLVGHRKCYLPSHALLQARRCYFACRVSSRFCMLAEVCSDAVVGHVQNAVVYAVKCFIAYCESYHIGMIWFDMVL